METQLDEVDKFLFMLVISVYFFSYFNNKCCASSRKIKILCLRVSVFKFIHLLNQFFIKNNFFKNQRTHEKKF